MKLKPPGHETLTVLLSLVSLVIGPLAVLVGVWLLWPALGVVLGLFYISVAVTLLAGRRLKRNSYWIEDENQ